MTQPNREDREQALERDAQAMSQSLGITVSEARIHLLGGKSVDEYDYLSEADTERILANVKAQIDAESKPA